MTLTITHIHALLKHRIKVLLQGNSDILLQQLVFKLNRNYEQEKQINASIRYSSTKEQRIKIPKNIPLVASNNFKSFNNVELPSSWNASHSGEHHIMYKVKQQCTHQHSNYLFHIPQLTVHSDMTWSLSIYGQWRVCNISWVT